VNLTESTLEALDWPFLLDALASRARTTLGRDAACSLEPTTDHEAIARWMDEVDDLSVLHREGRSMPPLSGIENVAPLLQRAVRGEVLEKAELRLAGGTVDGLASLAAYLEEQALLARTLAERGSDIAIDTRFRRTLVDSFDADGELSEAMYPALGELRRRIITLEKQARAVLEALVGSGQLDSILQDRYLTVRSDRFVLPVKAQAKSHDFGIVHDASRSGQTIYVEPHRVVPLNNERRLAEGQLRAEEHRILRVLSAELGRHATPLACALDAATAVDLAVARRELALRLDASRPVVDPRGGVIDLRQSRHPVLAFEGTPVVANDLRLDSERPVLVLTGPNAGGKTVALKTLGLAALLVRVGCFVPAAEGSRVDLFPTILADIGDRQTVHEGLSSFSGHLATLGEMLDAAGEGALLLLDELAAGTDPAQGGALARALIERFADAGARVVVTTHYAQLKAAAAADSRIAVAAMEYRDERPTYRVVPGMAGESHGLAAALRAGIDPALITRARELMDQGERALQDALAALERDRARAEERALAAEAESRHVREREAAVIEREERAKRRLRELEAGVATEFAAKLRVAEHSIARVIADLQREPSSQRAAAAREEIEVLAAVLDDVELAPAAEVVDAGSPLEVGSTVRVPALGLTGEVVALRDREVEVKARGMTLKLRPNELEVTGRASAGPPASTGAGRAQRRRPVFDTASLTRALRTESNTLDLRGARVAEGLAALDEFLDAAVLAGADAVFVLHGHGTGVLKIAVRKALADSPYVAGSGPAEPDQGGDAFTVAVLR
jgi:DNA mismatch repair protein MutS2